MRGLSLVVASGGNPMSTSWFKVAAHALALSTTLQAVGRRRLKEGPPSLLFSIYGFIFGFAGLSLVVASGGFPCRRTRALGHSGFSSCSQRALECELGSCGTWTYLLLDMWQVDS